MQKGLTFGFCVEEMGREGREQGAGLQGVWGGRREAEGQAEEDDVDTGRGLGVGFLKAAKKHKRRGRSQWQGQTLSSRNRESKSRTPHPVHPEVNCLVPPPRKLQTAPLMKLWPASGLL